jgi:hypothetical protein
MVAVSQEWENFQTASGLTGQELNFLVQEAQDADADLKEFDQASIQWRKQYPPGPLPAAAAQQQQAAKSQQRQQIVQGHINNLKGFFADDRWQLLYNFAWNTEAPHVQLTKLTTHPPTPLPRKPPN